MRCRTSWGATVSLGLVGLLGSVNAQAPGIELGFSWEHCGETVELAAPRSGVTTGVTCVMSSSASKPVSVAAWSVAIAFQGFEIGVIRSAGTDAWRVHEGAAFETTERLPGDLGVVSTVVLPIDDSLELPPDQEVSFLRVFGAAELGFDADSRMAVHVEFQDGLEGSTGPVTNEVTVNGQRVAPRLGACDLELRRVPEIPCPDADLPGIQAVLQSESVIEVPEPFAEVIRPSGEDATGRIEFVAGTGAVFAGIVSNGLPDQGVLSGIQGWSIGLAVLGDVSLDAASIDGTAAADEADGGLFDGGLRMVRLIDPEAHDGIQGVIASTVLSFTRPIALLPTGTATVLALELSGEPDQEGLVMWRDGLAVAQPVANTFTVAGESQRAVCHQSVEVSFTRPAPARFVRGEVNGDGAVDISDPISIFGFLFQGGPAPRCPEAADANADGRLDLSDPITVFNFLFQSSASASMAGPRSCEDEQPRIDEEDCPRGSTHCE